MEETLPREYPQKNQRVEAQDCKRYVYTDCLIICTIRAT